VRAKVLAHSLVVVEDLISLPMNWAIQIAVASAFAPVPPMSQNARTVISGSRGTLRDAVGGLGLGQRLGVVGARHDRHEIAFPNMLVLVWALLLVLQAGLVERLGEPGVIPPVQFDDL
jgi:hypothetical protein